MEEGVCGAHVLTFYGGQSLRPQGIQIDHVGGGGGHAGETKKTGFAVGGHGEEAVAGYVQLFD